MYCLEPLFFFLLLVISTTSQSNTKFMDCSPTTINCGPERLNISYPFRKPGMPEYCGHPEFEVSCTEDYNKITVPMIGIAEKKYHVLSINYDTLFFSLADIAYSADTCPKVITNSTFDPSLFNYFSNGINVVVYFNCSPTVTVPPNLTNIPCLGNNVTGYSSYFVVPIGNNVLNPEMLEKCDSLVVIRTYVNDVNPLEKGRMDFLGMLQDGFGLNWMVGKEWCGGCKGSGGVCGFNPISQNARTCFCSDGRTADGTCRGGYPVFKPTTTATSCQLSSCFSYNQPQIQTNISFKKMKPNLFSYLFLSSFLKLLSVSADHLDMKCEVSSCGNITTISYPFWLSGKQPSYCGFPEFELRCKDEIPLIEMSFGEYQVKKIFYENNSLVVANDELVRRECPLFHTNLSFSVTPFKISPLAHRALYLFYNCSHVGPNWFSVGCASIYEPIEVFAYLGGDYGSPEYFNAQETCSVADYMPVLDYPGAASSQYRALIRNGFLLGWAVPDCDHQCTESGGRCGYTNVTNNFACICPDRLHLKSCSKSL